MNAGEVVLLSTIDRMMIGKYEIYAACSRTPPIVTTTTANPLALALDPHLSCCVVSVLAMGLHCMSVSEKVDVIFTYPLG